MPLITGWITHHGAVIAVRIGVSRDQKRSLKAQGKAVPERIAVAAQIDTGSFVSGFSRKYFESLGLERFAQILVRTPSTKLDEPHVGDQYEVGVELSPGAGALTIKALAGDDFGEHDEVQGIIGRDILQCCVFQYFGPDGKFMLAF